MYGTIARMHVKPGREQELEALGQELAANVPPGLVIEYIYRMDKEPHIFYMVVIFTSEETYLANANSAEQDAQYRRLRALLEEDPEWHDGEVVAAHEAITHGL